MPTDSGPPLPHPPAQEPWQPSPYTVKPQLPVTRHGPASLSVSSFVSHHSHHCRHTDGIEVLRAGLNAHFSVPCLRGWFSVLAVPSAVSFLHIYLLPICQGPGNAPSLIMYPTV